jgi:hypothetical protein
VAQPGTLKGEVLEVQDVPNYTYLRLKTTQGEVWAAVPTAQIALGSEVTLNDAQPMGEFKSQTLKRTFPQIYFASLPAAPTSAEQEAHAGMDISAHAAAAKPLQAGDIAKASGADARTVAEILTSTPDFKDTTVTVRAQVVKYSSDIMGKNWLHLRDGTGNQADGSNDLVVTTQESTQIGEVLLVKGMVRRDQDFGSGYSFRVMIEGATLQR